MLTASIAQLQGKTISDPCNTEPLFSQQSKEVYTDQMSRTIPK